MSDTAWAEISEVKCRCGQVGEITGVEGSLEFPETVWVAHRVGLGMQTHIHRRPQMQALVGQRVWQNACSPATDTESATQS